ncbi:recombinase family protein [Actinoplanes sp. Pm04-4]|uniref:Recombinase family protein n=1 Tax=Paractinoplanes pyxinae TaxID=2997416 RepID=A0ABT4BE86_9ACTN|nr:recombinase family protein [Actinoplanes pyxinae]MCY1144130.1 recombinase family protein [Actinoplanes pyxinae]
MARPRSNALGVIPPSAHDRARNSHRTGAAWTLRIVAAILGNPRYTGRQVWNRQSVDHHESDSGDKTTREPGRKPTHGWNTKDQWVISTQQAHPPLISEADFVRAQHVNAITRPDDGGTPRRYQLTGLVLCGLCGRRAEGHWANGRARYRCRHGATSSRDATAGRMPTLYLREDQLLTQVAAQLPDVHPDDITAHMRARQMTIVCTAVSATLEILAATGGKHGLKGPIQPTIPGLGHRSSGGKEKPPPPPPTKRERHLWGLTCPEGDLNPHAR